MAKQDGELSSWLIVGILFTLTLIGMDIWYSSFAEMGFFKWIVYGLHCVLGAFIIITFIQFNDPNYDKVRKWVVYLSVVLMLIVGIHHALVREDKQVLIDSKENAEKQRIEDSVYKAHLPHSKDSVK